ncbi:MAG: PqiC family protein [Proteobacteria bacterium]|jgi:ABC-type uncharacterized transport system auxiliary subunit|nr:PqiC family protein [Pseudomonadota bacterium]
MNTQSARTLLLLTISASFLPSCGALSAAKAPGDARFFSMERAPSQAVAAPAEVPGGTGDPLKLRLGRVTGAPHLEERVVYRDSAHEIGYYREVRWSEPPELFLKRQLARVLFEDRGIRHVMGGAERTLLVKLTALDEILAPQHLARAQVVVKLHDEHVVLWEKTLTVDRPVAVRSDGDLAIATIEALGEAMQAIVDRIADGVVRELEARR